MEITFLGTGTSTGIPIIGCPCSVCLSKNPKDKRLRTSIFVNHNNLNFIIDTGPDLRTQLLTNKIKSCDFAIITHDHSDHLVGIDDLRPFTFLPKSKSMSVFCHSIHFNKICDRFDYIFKRDIIFNAQNPYLGGGLPLLDLKNIDQINSEIPNLSLDYLLLPHGTGQSLGLIFGQVAYLIDCHDIPKEALQKLQSLELECVIIDCLQRNPHPSHLTVEKSFEFLSIINPKKAYLIHMNHDLQHDWLEKLALSKFSFPVIPAHDGLKINI